MLFSCWKLVEGRIIFHDERMVRANVGECLCCPRCYTKSTLTVHRCETGRARSPTWVATWVSTLNIGHLRGRGWPPAREKGPISGTLVSFWCPGPLGARL